MIHVAMPRKKKPAEPKKQPRYPSRDNYVGVYITKTVADKLRAIAEEQERSLSFMVKKACEEYIKSHSKDKS